MEILKVSSKSNPSKVAGAIANIFREKGTVEIQTIGAGSLNQAINKIEARIKAEEENRKNAINTFNSTLGSAAYTESDMYALAGSYDNRVLQSVYDTKIAELEATILALTARVEALEPESETPVEGE